MWEKFLSLNWQTPITSCNEKVFIINKREQMFLSTTGTNYLPCEYVMNMNSSVNRRISVTRKISSTGLVSRRFGLYVRFQPHKVKEMKEASTSFNILSGFLDRDSRKWKLATELNENYNFPPIFLFRLPHCFHYYYYY